MTGPTESRASAGSGPFDSAAGAQYLDELRTGARIAELEAVLGADAGPDLELSQEQYALAAVVAEMATTLSRIPVVADVARQLLADDAEGGLFTSARDSMDRLLKNPFALLWRDHPDGGIAIKREVRALRARLHRACSG